jgi:hypothetical protein
MQPIAEDARMHLVSRIEENLQRVERRVVRLRRTNVQFIGLSLVFSTVATLLAGLTAAAGPLLGEGTPAWRWTCGLIAIVTAAAAFTTGFHQRFQIPEHLARALSCAGRLRRLDLAIRLSRLGLDEVGNEYEELIATYPEELI